MERPAELVELARARKAPKACASVDALELMLEDRRTVCETRGDDVNGPVGHHETQATGQSRFTRECVEDSRDYGWVRLKARQHGYWAWLAVSRISDIRKCK